LRPIDGLQRSEAVPPEASRAKILHRLLEYAPHDTYQRNEDNQIQPLIRPITDILFSIICS